MDEYFNSGLFIATNTPQRLIPRNDNRRQLTLRNEGIQTVRVGYQDLNANKGIPMLASEAVIFNFFKGEIWVMTTTIGVESSVSFIEE
ncbi:MAG: hypothetical protein AAB958_00575 [Patescibacteria group bacterium]